MSKRVVNKQKYFLLIAQKKKHFIGWNFLLLKLGNRRRTNHSFFFFFFFFFLTNLYLNSKFLLRIELMIKWFKIEGRQPFQYNTFHLVFFPWNYFRCLNMGRIVLGPKINIWSIYHAYLSLRPKKSMKIKMKDIVFH